MDGKQSRYFETAERMDEAFLDLLADRDLELVTIKDVCARAGVHRSTFYLHYETIDDLLAESTALMNHRFAEHMERGIDGPSGRNLVSRIPELPAEELVFVRRDYVVPYLTYVRDNRRLYACALRNSRALRLDRTYRRMLEHVIEPVLDRLDVPQADRRYLLAYHMAGLMAIVRTWLEDGCADAPEHVAAVMERCIAGRREGNPAERKES